MGKIDIESSLSEACLSVNALFKKRTLSFDNVLFSIHTDADVFLTSYPFRRQPELPESLL